MVAGRQIVPGVGRDFLLKKEAELPIQGKRAAKLPVNGYRKVH